MPLARRTLITGFSSAGSSMKSPFMAAFLPSSWKFSGVFMPMLPGMEVLIACKLGPALRCGHVDWCGVVHAGISLLVDLPMGAAGVGAQTCRV